MSKFRKLGFVDYTGSGGLTVNSEPDESEKRQRFRQVSYEVFTNGANLGLPQTGFGDAEFRQALQPSSPRQASLRAGPVTPFLSSKYGAKPGTNCAEGTGWLVFHRAMSLDNGRHHFDNDVAERHLEI